MHRTTLQHIGEFGFIERIRKQIKNQNKNLIYGIGDDAAVIKYNKTEYLLATTDSLLENIHFSLKTTPAKNIGKKAILVNISDIIAMGGIPTYVLVSVGLPKFLPFDLIYNIYLGMKEVTTKYSIDIIGGDTINSNKGIIINILMLGKVKKNELKLRKGTKPKDLILVTGELGNSKIGLELLNKKNKLKINKRYKKYFIYKHFLPPVRIEEAKLIASSPYVTSLTDISDGLSNSLFTLARLNKVNIKIYPSLLPYSKYLKKSPPLEYLLYGGEEYELLFTISPQKINKLFNKFQNTAIFIIGEVTVGKGEVYIIEKNRKKKLVNLGFDHFLKR